MGSVPCPIPLDSSILPIVSGLEPVVDIHDGDNGWCVASQLSHPQATHHSLCVTSSDRCSVSECGNYGSHHVVYREWTDIRSVAVEY